MKFFVFYSNTCQYCQKLLKYIQEEKLNDYCSLICFETNPDKIPEFITNVPTIIAKDLSKPLVGLETIEWIKNKKYFNQTTNNIKTTNIINPNIQSALKELEFNKSEIMSISDKYTTINDTQIEKVLMNYDNITKPIINNTTKIKENKITNELQEQKLRELISLRKHQINSKLIGMSKIKL